ncbi:hypothetical protein BGZ89_001328 [Linnemannia elongata]|nr:hypothetical protein BGZ89_001328 [Linnemannia elongata]
MAVISNKRAMDKDKRKVKVKIKVKVRAMTMAMTMTALMVHHPAAIGLIPESTLIPISIHQSILISLATTTTTTTATATTTAILAPTTIQN